MPNYQKTANALFKSEPVAARPDSATGSMRLVTRRGVPVMYAATPRRPVSGREGANCADYADSTRRPQSAKEPSRMQKIENEYLGQPAEQF